MDIGSRGGSTIGVRNVLQVTNMLQRLRNYINSSIDHHIAYLEKEQFYMQCNLEMYPPGSFGQARLNLGIEIWQFKIELWKSVKLP